MNNFKVRIEGIAPLLQHRYVFKDELEEAGIKRSGKPDYSQQWKAALYYDDGIGIYQPSSHVEGALIKAATSYQIPGKGKKTYKDLFKAAVIVNPELIEHGIKGDLDELVKEGKILLDKRPVVVQRARVERIRPRFDDWALDFEIQVNDDQIAKEIVQQILEFAGRYVGIGDFRPKFGRFSVAHFE